MIEWTHKEPDGVTRTGASPTGYPKIKADGYKNLLKSFRAFLWVDRFVKTGEKSINQFCYIYDGIWEKHNKKDFFVITEYKYTIVDETGEKDYKIPTQDDLEHAKEEMDYMFNNLKPLDTNLIVVCTGSSCINKFFQNHPVDVVTFVTKGDRKYKKGKDIPKTVTTPKKEPTKIELKKTNGVYTLTKKEFLDAKRVILKIGAYDERKYELIHTYHPRKDNVLRITREYKKGVFAGQKEDECSHDEAWDEYKRNAQDNKHWVEQADVKVMVIPKNEVAPKAEPKKEPEKKAPAKKEKMKKAKPIPKDILSEKVFELMRISDKIYESGKSLLAIRARKEGDESGYRNGMWAVYSKHSFNATSGTGGRGSLQYIVNYMLENKCSISGFFRDKFVGTVRYSTGLETAKPISKRAEQLEYRRNRRLSGAKTVRRLMKEGKKIPTNDGHVTRLGIARQTGTSNQTKEGRKMDKTRKAILPGYRISKSGRLYRETRANRSDTPIERRDAAYMHHQRKRIKGTGRVHIPDKYIPPKYAIPRTAKYITKQVEVDGKRYRDNYLTKIAVGHWFNQEHEYQILKAKDGTDKGAWFIWRRKLPSFNMSETCSSNWVPYLKAPVLKYGSLEQAVKAFEDSFRVTKRVYTADTEIYRAEMTDGLYKWIQKRHKIGTYEPNDKVALPKIRKYEKIIHDYPVEKHENLLSFDNLGNLLYHAVGAEGECREHLYIRNIASYKCHNHPYTHKASVSFSIGDINNNASNAEHGGRNLHMMRAVGYGKWWSMKRPWNMLENPDTFMGKIDDTFDANEHLGEKEKYEAVNTFLEENYKKLYGDKFDTGKI